MVCMSTDFGLSLEGARKTAKGIFLKIYISRRNEAQ